MRLSSELQNYFAEMVCITRDLEFEVLPWVKSGRILYTTMIEHETNIFRFIKLPEMQG